MVNYDNPWLICYQKKPAAVLRMFCFHYAGGSASAYRDWANKLPTNVELIGIQLPGREGRYHETYITYFRQLVTCLVEATRPVLDKPYVVFGHSMGSLIGFEWIRELKQVGLRAPHLFFAAGRQAPQFADDDPFISALPEPEFIEELLKDYAETLANVLEHKELREVFIPQLRADFALCEDYRYLERVKLDCPIVAYAGEGEHKITEQKLSGWKDHTSMSFKSRRFSGGHFFVHGAEDVLLADIRQELGRVLSAMASGVLSA